MGTRHGADDPQDRKGHYKAGSTGVGYTTADQGGPPHCGDSIWSRSMPPDRDDLKIEGSTKAGTGTHPVASGGHRIVGAQHGAHNTRDGKGHYNAHVNIGLFCNAKSLRRDKISYATPV